MKNSKWNSPAMKQMRDVAWGQGMQRFLYSVLRKGQSTSERLANIDAANAKRRRRQERNLKRAQA